MKLVTDPNILAQLENDEDNYSSRNPVTDPELLRQLEGDDNSYKNKIKSFFDYLTQPKLPLGVNAASGLLSLYGKNPEQKALIKDLPQIASGRQAGIPEKLAQGIGEYAPFGAAGGASLGGQLLAGAGHGALTNDPNQQNLFVILPQGKLGGALEGAGINALTHGAFKGLEQLRPSKLLRGKLSPEELQKNVEATQGTTTGLGDVISSPILKKQYENFLSKIPFSGVTGKLEKAAESVKQKGKDILDKLLGKNNPENVNDQLHSALNKQAELQTNKKIALYDTVDKTAEKSGFRPTLTKFSNMAKDFEDTINDSQILKYEPEIRKIFKKVGIYSKASPFEKHINAEYIPNEQRANIINPDNYPLGNKSLVNKNGESFDISYDIHNNPTLKEANLLKGLLGKYANEAKYAGKRNEARILNNLHRALKSDIGESIEDSGHTLLKDQYKKAEENYAKNFSPFLDRDIYKYTSGNPKTDIDLLTQSFIKTSKTTDRSKVLSKLTKKLSDKELKLLGYSYFSRALDNEGNLNLNKLATLSKNLGKNQFKALVPDDALRKEIFQYQKLHKMNNKALNVMQNQSTGQQILDLIPAILAHAGTALTGGAVGGIPGALIGLVAPGLAAKPITHLLTSPKYREALVKAMLENKSWNKNIPQGLESLLQGSNNQRKEQ